MKSTAIANSNIALVKYWGKRDEKLILPTNSSISMTLDKLHTTTTVEFSPSLKEDQIKIDGKKILGEEAKRVSQHLGLVRKMKGENLFARVESENNFPKAAGLASSASAFAALSLAATKAIGFALSRRELSILARQGSGSASRSIQGGYNEWMKGTKEDGSDSYSKQIAPQSHWQELRMLVTVLTTKEKKVKSRAGMAQTVANSPLYKAWLETVEKDLETVRSSILEKSLFRLGPCAELNALKMHSTMMTTQPHIMYWEPESIAMMKEVMQMREDGISAYFTMDGGPQVKILCLENDAKKIQKRASELKGVEKTILCSAGEDAKTIEKGLF
ncbi:MAG: diphosphomevalonate decarboxylase [archaeon]|nr:diphosphomevalonate decarboxylase [archaeon]